MPLTRRFHSSLQAYQENRKHSKLDRYIRPPEYEIAPFINLKRIWRPTIQFMCGMSLDSNVVCQLLDGQKCHVEVPEEELDCLIIGSCWMSRDELRRVE